MKRDHRRTPPPRWQPHLHLYTLCALTLAQPLLALLARHPEFFTARRWGIAGASVLAVTLVCALPLVPVAIRAVLAARSERLASGFMTSTAGLAAAVLLLQLMQSSELATLAVILALAGGALGAWCYHRFAIARTYLSFLSLALLAVPLAFVLDPRIQRLGKQAPAEISGLEIDAEAPIFVLIFDALSATALMDDQQLVNARRYPHLAELAEGATWFSNAASVARWTLEAIPAMLTGEMPHPQKLARLADHPRNLFTLLGGSYRIVASEAVVELCPPQLNAYPVPETPTAATTLISDLGLIWLHLSLPTDLSRRLPRVDQAWGGFADPKARVGGQIGRFYQFLGTFDPDAPPTLYYLHVVFPHMPYQYLPSGKMFRARVSKFLQPASPGSRGAADEETRIFLYKRYLLQTGLVDRMVGDFTRRLDELGLYERSYVILTADHGGRLAALGHPEDIAFVPLLIKRPHAAAGTVHRQPVSTLDLLPSLLDLLGVPDPDGGRRRSFFDADYEPPAEVYENGRRRPFSPELYRDKQELVAWKLDRFGDGEDPLSLYRAGGPRPDLLGEHLENLQVSPEPRLRVELDLGGPKIDYDPRSALAPVLISGSLRLEGYRQPCCQLALSVNGRIEATMTARPHQPPDWLRFRALVAESVLRPGANDFKIWVVPPGAGHLLAPRQP